MSLFDVIRYPISDMPQDEELMALPPKLLEHLDALGPDYINYSPASTAIILRIMLRQPKNKQAAKDAIKEIKRRLEKLP